METVRIGVIGGSGLYHMPELTDITEVRINTPFGPTSDVIMIGTLHGQRVAFLPRHGRGHVHMPSEVPYRANIYALKTLGVSHVLSVSACGSLMEVLQPGNIVVPDQLVDYTRGERAHSFFGGGMVAHVSVADPFCPTMISVLTDACTLAGGRVHRGGTFVTIEGPRFSTRGESKVWRQLGFSIIGMTTSPEAFLAREAEMHYGVMAHVTDYDVWHTGEPVTADMVISQFNANLMLAQKAIANAVEHLATVEFACECGSALKGAIATKHDLIPAETLERLRPIVGKYVK